MFRRSLLIGLTVVQIMSISIPVGAAEHGNNGSVEHNANYLNNQDTAQLTSASMHLIQTQADWDELISGVADSANWTSGSYNGTEDVNITLGCDVISGMDVLNIAESVSVTLDLNGHTFSSSTGTFTFDADGSNNINAAMVKVQNGTVIATKIAYNDTQNGTSMSISNVDFVDCRTTALDLKQIDTVTISGCGFFYNKATNDGTQAVAVDCRYANSLTLNDLEIADFYTGVNADYATSPQMNNLTISGSYCGIHMGPVSGIYSIKNSSITGTLESGSCGLYLYGCSSNVLSDLQNGTFQIDNVAISNCDAGIYNYTSEVSIANSKIQNCNAGCTGGHGMTFGSGSGSFLLYNCDLSSVENPNEESYGVVAKTTGLYCINTKIEGFRCGAGNVYANSGNASARIINSTFNNLEKNLWLHCGVVVGCELTGAKVGIHAADATTCVYDTKITGPGKNVAGSVGILDASSATIHYWGLDEALTADKASLTYGSDTAYSYVVGNGTYTAKDAVIQGFEKGLSINRSANTVLANAEIKDCTTGVSSEQGANTYFYDNLIHDCTTGIIAKTSFIPGNTKVYGCNTGFVVTGMAASNGSAINGYSRSPLLETYGNEVGLKATNAILNSLFLATYDNSGDGLQLEGNNAQGYVTLSAYENGGWNVNCLDTISTLYVVPGNMTTHTYIDGGLGNMNLNLSQDPRYASGIMEVDNGQFFLVPGRKLYLSPSVSGATSPTDWLDGTMTFHLSDSDYTEGRIVADAINGIVGNEVFTATHFFMLKEGWVLKQNATANSTTLELAEGCEVVYDYKTNGGAAWSGDFEKRSYVKDSAIDLSYTATKPGYEFLGWNTNPDAHEGLEQLSAGTQDITLYAIYRKEVTLTYHAYSDSFDYTQTAYRFNKEDSLYSDEKGVKTLKLLPYGVSDSAYKFVGYTFDDTTDNLNQAGVAVPDNITEVYCVYSMKGTLVYCDTDGEELFSFNQTNVHIAEGVLSNRYCYEVTTYIPAENYAFDGWVNDGKLYQEGEVFTTSRNRAVLTAVVSEMPRLVTVRGQLLGADKKPIANAEILLNKKGTIISSDDALVGAEYEYKTTTNSQGYYVFENIPIGIYVCAVRDASGQQLATCEVTVHSNADRKSDSVEVTEKQTDVRVKSEINENVFEINVYVSQQITPLTGDADYPGLAIMIMAIMFAMGLIFLLFRKK